MISTAKAAMATAGSTSSPYGIASVPHRSCTQPSKLVMSATGTLASAAIKLKFVAAERCPIACSTIAEYAA